MENKTFMLPLAEGKSILRSTGEVVEIIDFEIKERGARSDEDWVTYIDSKGKEHIREKLNVQLDFKTEVSNTLQKILDFTTGNKMPTTRNCRIFEVAKELVVNNGFLVDKAVSYARELVDEIGIW